MVFLVPSQFDSFVPPSSNPGQRAPEDAPTRPWNGDLAVTGLRPSDRTHRDKIPVSAIETDGEKLESWPNEFHLEIVLSDRDLRSQMSQWVAANGHPTCNFIPARLRGSNQRDTNQATFRALSRVLMENHTVAYAPWRSGDNANSIIIYPAPNSSAYLIGVVFHSGTGIPDFVRSALSPTVVIPPALPQYPATYQGHHTQQSYRHSQQSSSPHHSNPNSPVDHPGSSYRSIQPMPASRSQGHSYYQPGGSYPSNYPSNPPLP